MPASSAGDFADLVKIGALLFLAIFPEFGYWLLSTTSWVVCRITVCLFAIWHEYETRRIRTRELDGDRLWRAKAQLKYRRIKIEPRAENLEGRVPMTTNQMEKAMTDFELALDDAVRNTQPRRIHSRYSKVNVLMLTWEGEESEAEIETLHEVQNLKSVFEEHYNYSVSTWKVPHELSVLALNARLTKLCYEQDAADNSFIIYYAGHRVQEGKKARWSTWSSSTGVLMRNAEKILAPQASDVLFLIETPYKPYQGRLNGNLARSESLLEVLTGPPHTSTLTFSFTKALIEALTPSEPPAGPVCVQDLYLRVFQSLRGIGSPILHSLSPVGSQRSIKLPVLGPQAPIIIGDKSTPGSPSRQNSIGTMQDGEVLIHIKLSEESDASTTTQWIEWQKGIPPSAKDIQIEASYRSRSESLECVGTQLGDTGSRSKESTLKMDTNDSLVELVPEGPKDSRA
ncbi:hypothetical protein B0J14DRAFT_260686 [Halenospora varia]|nr:hypothetical protein B0J14DRAFT_260686 [Halenospora varia]